jgi:fatty-acyl-CoA synthase
VDTNRPVPPGEVGVIWLRGPNVTNGYLGDPAATQSSIVDGWLNTGDMAISDARGYLSIVGRSVDAFKRGGANVYPAEIEVVLGEHPDIEKAAVIGVPDAIQGEIGVAYVVKRPGAPLSAQDIIDYCRGELATYKVPAHVRFVDTLPETPTGKVQKFLLREAWTPSADPSPVST